MSTVNFTSRPIKRATGARRTTHPNPYVSLNKPAIRSEPTDPHPDNLAHRYKVRRLNEWSYPLAFPVPSQARINTCDFCRDNGGGDDVSDEPCDISLEHNLGCSKEATWRWSVLNEKYSQKTSYRRALTQALAGKYDTKVTINNGTTVLLRARRGPGLPVADEITHWTFHPRTSCTRCLNAGHKSCDIDPAMGYGCSCCAEQAADCCFSGSVFRVRTDPEIASALRLRRRCPRCIRLNRECTWLVDSVQCSDSVPCFHCTEEGSHGIKECKKYCGPKQIPGPRKDDKCHVCQLYGIKYCKRVVDKDGFVRCLTCVDHGYSCFGEHFRSLDTDYEYLWRHRDEIEETALVEIVNADLIRNVTYKFRQIGPQTSNKYSMARYDYEVKTVSGYHRWKAYKEGLHRYHKQQKILGRSAPAPYDELDVPILRKFVRANHAIQCLGLLDNVEAAPFEDMSIIAYMAQIHGFVKYHGMIMAAVEAWQQSELNMWITMLNSGEKLFFNFTEWADFHDRDYDELYGAEHKLYTKRRNERIAKYGKGWPRPFIFPRFDVAEVIRYWNKEIANPHLGDIFIFQAGGILEAPTEGVTPWFECKETEDIVEWVPFLWKRENNDSFASFFHRVNVNLSWARGPKRIEVFEPEKKCLHNRTVKFVEEIETIPLYEGTWWLPFEDWEIPLQTPGTNIAVKPFNLTKAELVEAHQIVLQHIALKHDGTGCPEELQKDYGMLSHWDAKDSCPENFWMDHPDPNDREVREHQAQKKRWARHKTRKAAEERGEHVEIPNVVVPTKAYVLPLTYGKSMNTGEYRKHIVIDEAPAEFLKTTTSIINPYAFTEGDLAALPRAPDIGFDKRGMIQKSAQTMVKELREERKLTSILRKNYDDKEPKEATSSENASAEDNQAEISSLYVEPCEPRPKPLGCIPWILGDAYPNYHDRLSHFMAILAYSENFFKGDCSESDKANRIIYSDEGESEFWSDENSTFGFKSDNADDDYNDDCYDSGDDRAKQIILRPKTPPMTYSRETWPTSNPSSGNQVSFHTSAAHASPITSSPQIPTSPSFLNALASQLGSPVSIIYSPHISAAVVFSSEPKPRVVSFMLPSPRNPVNAAFWRPPSPFPVAWTTDSGYSSRDDLTDDEDEDNYGEDNNSDQESDDDGDTDDDVEEVAREPVQAVRSVSRKPPPAPLQLGDARMQFAVVVSPRRGSPAFKSPPFKSLKMSSVNSPLQSPALSPPKSHIISLGRSPFSSPKKSPFSPMKSPALSILLSPTASVSLSGIPSPHITQDSLGYDLHVINGEIIYSVRAVLFAPMTDEDWEYEAEMNGMSVEEYKKVEIPEMEKRLEDFRRRERERDERKREAMEQVEEEKET